MSREPTEKKWEPGQRESHAFSVLTASLDGTRSALRLSMRLSKEWYVRVFEDAKKASRAKRDGKDPVEVAIASSEGLDPLDYEWLLLSSALRDGVSILEVYLASALNELLYPAGLQLRSGALMRWEDRDLLFTRLIGRFVASPEVGEARALRDLLVERGGELRKDRDREHFAKTKEPGSRRVASLNLRDIERFFEHLQRTAEGLDPAVWARVWGGREARKRHYDRLRSVSFKKNERVSKLVEPLR